MTPGQERLRRAAEAVRQEMIRRSALAPPHWPRYYVQPPGGGQVDIAPGLWFVSRAPWCWS